MDVSQVSNDFLSKIEMFNKEADETKELVKKTFGLKSNKNSTSSSVLNTTSSMISVKAPEQIEFKREE